jgi:N-acetylneuraminate synthase
MQKKNKIFLIAEIGINHNGDIDITKKLIDNAVLAGFDAVKFQKRTIDLVYDAQLLDQPRVSPWGNTQRDQKQGLEFGEKEYDQINDYCKQKKIIWFASAWDVKSLEFLDRYNLPYHKIASAMIVDQNFLKEVAKRKKYTFISTGMSSLDDIKKAVNIFEAEGTNYELMHCVSTYPTNPKDVNLNTINSLKREFNCKVGYSGHENGVAISIVASTMGINSLERHITLDRTMYGSDQAASIEFSGMKDLTDSINKVQAAMGGEKLGEIIPEEIPIAKKLRAHIKI